MNEEQIQKEAKIIIFRVIKTRMIRKVMEGEWDKEIEAFLKPLDIKPEDDFFIGFNVQIDKAGIADILWNLKHEKKESLFG